MKLGLGAFAVRRFWIVGMGLGLALTGCRFHSGQSEVQAQAPSPSPSPSPTPSLTYSALILSHQPVAYFRMGDPGIPGPETYHPALSNPVPTSGDAIDSSIRALSSTYRDRAYIQGSFSAWRTGFFQFGQPGAIRDTDTSVTFSGLQNANNQNSQYIELASSTSYFSGNSSGVTLEAWVKPIDVDQDRRILSFARTATGGSAMALLGGRAAGSASAFFRGAGGVLVQLNSPAGSYVAGRWHHLVATLDSNGAKLYLNGVAVSESAAATLSDSLVLDALSAKIGSAPGLIVSNFAGGIDEVAIYDRALSLEEIQSHYSWRIE